MANKTSNMETTLWDKVLWLFIGLALLGSAIGWFVYETVNSDTIIYKGSEIFQTNQEYVGFKTYCLNEVYEIKEMSLLASEPPIYAKYEMEIRRGVEFPYNVDEDYAHQSLESVLYFIFAGVFGILVTIAGVIAFCEKEKTDGV